MGIPELQNEIMELESKRDSLLRGLDELMLELQPIMYAEAERWINRHVVGRIQDRPDLLEEEGMSNLKSLKEKVGNLIQTLPDNAPTEISDKSRWLHRNESKSPLRVESSVREYFTTVSRLLVGQLGALLAEYKLVGTERGRTAEWEGNTSGVWKYKCNPGFELNQKAEYRRYIDGYQQLGETERSITEAQKRLISAKAKESWESA